MKRVSLNRLKKSKGGSWLPLTLAIVISLFLLIPVKVLVIENFFNQEIRKFYPVDEKFYLGIIYTHSVEKTETSEWYREANNKLVLMEERYKSLGAGLPANSPYKFEKTPEGFRLYDINEEMNGVVYRTGAVVANHKLILGDKEVYFQSFSTPREALAFKIKNVALFKIIFWRCKGV